MAEKKTEQFYTRPPILGKWEGFRIFLWNSETNQFMGRTGASWGKIILFYILFYAALIGFFAAMIAVFYTTLDKREPKWQLDKSVIGTNPGLGFRPMPPSENVESTLIWYKPSDKGNVEYWKNELNGFLDVYNKSKNPNKDNLYHCERGQPPPLKKVCEVEITNEWRPCHNTWDYNYNSDVGGPCIFLKLNKIFGWIPEYYDLNSIPPEMPEEVVAKIRKFNGTDKAKTVWISCDGENPADQENVGPKVYFPDYGFSGEYFPFQNIEGYLSPLVAVFFERPRRGVLINIECKAWAKNIYHDRHERRGSVHFELMVD